MTSSPAVVTSESPDVNNTSTSFNVTVAANNIKTLAGHVSPTIPFLVMTAILFALAIVNVCGNGFTLITIRMTPRLWTNTNFILTSMHVSHFVTGVSMFWYNPYILLVNVFNHPCRMNVVVTILTSLIKVTSYVSNHHIILIGIERYIAIVHPLQYENVFTDRKLRWVVVVVWASSIVMGMSHMLWLINADLRKCTIIPAQYNLIEPIFFIPLCISLITCYGIILAISWRQRRRIEPQPTNANPVPGSSLQTMAPMAVVTAKLGNKATTGDDTVDSNDKPMTGTGAPPEPAGTSGPSPGELTQEQQRQMIKSRRREFKAVYLTAAIVGTFVILWFPLMLSRILESVGYNPVVSSYVRRVGGSMGTFNYASTWVIYAAVSKSYRRAYRQMLIRIGCCSCKNIALPVDNSLIV